MTTPDDLRRAKALTVTQAKALRFIAERNGEGAVNKNGSLTCAGELACADPNNPKHSQFSSATWLRLVTFGLLESAGPLRLRVTDAGRQLAEEREG